MASDRPDEQSSESQGQTVGVGFRVSGDDKASLGLILLARKAKDSSTTESDLLRSYFDFEGMRAEAERVRVAIEGIAA